MRPDHRDTDNPFGVLDFLAWDHAKFGQHYRPGEIEQTAALMQEAGVGFVKFDFLWEDIEPESGHFDFAKYDRIVETLQRYGVRTQGLLSYNPPWSGRAWNQAPDVVSFCRYARAVVDHFQDRVRHWELCQEPDNPTFWQPQDNMRSYVNLIRHAYPVIKSIDPSCVIHLGGMSRSLPMSLREVYEAGGKDCFDVVNIHPFADPRLPGAMDAIRHMHAFILRVMQHYGDGEKPIWFTEIGCPGMLDPHAAKDWWLGPNPDEDVQASWVTSVYTEMLQWKNVKKIFWCFFRDTNNHFQAGPDYDGLIRHDFSKKPSFLAYQKLAHRYTDAFV
jgi:hypothetical protein